MPKMVGGWMLRMFCFCLLFFFNYLINFIYLFIIFGCVGSSLLHAAFLWLWRGRAVAVRGLLLQWLLLLRSTGSRRVGFSSCGTWAQ